MYKSKHCPECGKKCYGKLCSDCFSKNKYPLSKGRSIRRYQHNNDKRGES